MMEIFKLLGTIAINNDEANKSLDETSGKAKAFGGKLTSFLGSAAKGLAVATTAAVTTATAAVVGITKTAMDAYGDYEQLVGGAELMFGDAFDYVMEQSKNAYSTVQMSQNDYLQQVNGFAVGLKTALGGNEQAAAELANKIITAEADVVAATGNSQEAVQNAFNGIMKSNFTMLDNLQIGITPTKEGFQEVIDKVNEWNKANGEATDYQIDNLADCQSALVDYIEMQGLSGYAAAEASDTIQGSLSGAKAAWENLMIGIGSGDDIDELINNLFDTLGKAGENIIPRVSQILTGIGKALATGLPKLVEQIGPILQQDLPVLINAAVDMVNQVVPVLVALLPDILTTLIDAVVSNLPTLIPTLLTGAIDLFLALVQAIPVVAEALWEAMPAIIDAVLEGLKDLPDKICGLFGKSWDEVKEIFAPVGDFFKEKWAAIWSTLKPIVEAMQRAFKEAWELIKIVWDKVKPYFEMVWKNIKAIFSVVKSVLSSYFKYAWEAIKAVWNVVTAYFAAVWNTIADIFSVVKNVLSGNFSEAWEGIKRIVSTWAGFFGTVWTNIKNVFGAVKTFFKEAFEAAWQGVKDVFANVGEFFGSVWDKIKDKFSDLGTNISEAIGDSVKAGINTVITMIENTINGAIGLINGAIKIINKLPGVDVSTISELSIPRLEQGGILEKGQVGLLEGNGAEAVVPLENNRKWIAKVSEDMQTQGVGSANEESLGILRDILSILRYLKQEGENLPDTLTQAMADGLSFSINNREFARLVKAVN